MRSTLVRCSCMPASRRRTTFGRSRSRFRSNLSSMGRGCRRGRSSLTTFLRRCRSGCMDRSGRNGRLVIHNRNRCTVIGCTAARFRRRDMSRSSRSSRSRCRSRAAFGRSCRCRTRCRHRSRSRSGYRLSLSRRRAGHSPRLPQPQLQQNRQRPVQ